MKKFILLVCLVLIASPVFGISSSVQRCVVKKTQVYYGSHRIRSIYTRSFDLAKLVHERTVADHDHIFQKFEQKRHLHIRYCENTKQRLKHHNNCRRILYDMERLYFDLDCQLRVSEYAFEILSQAYDNEKSSQGSRKN